MNRGRIRVTVSLLSMLGAAAALALALSIISRHSAMAGSGDTQPRAFYDGWIARAPMPTARNGLTAAAVDGEIYVIGGSPGPLTVTGKVEIYDPAAGSWRTGTKMPTPRWLMSAAVMDGSIYVVGGNALGDFGTALAVTEVYDPATDTWAEGAPLPTARWGMGVGVVDGRLYAIGGASVASGWETANEAYRPLAPYRVLLPLTVRSSAP